MAQIATSFGWKSAEDTYSHSYLLPSVLQIATPLSPRRVLDIGTGNGSALPVWCQQGWNVCAMEPDREGWELARKVSAADVRNLGVGSEIPSDWQQAFDVAICLEVVEHLFDPHELVASVQATLKPGGHAIISTPYHGYWKNLALALANKWDFHHHPERVGGHIKFWSKDTLRELFASHGFEAVSFHGAGRFFPLWKSMIWVFRKAI